MPEWVFDLFPNVVVITVFSALFLLGLVRLACFHKPIGSSRAYLTKVLRRFLPPLKGSRYLSDNPIRTPWGLLLNEPARSPGQSLGPEPCAVHPAGEEAEGVRDLLKAVGAPGHEKSCYAAATPAFSPIRLRIGACTAHERKVI